MSWIRILGGGGGGRRGILQSNFLPSVLQAGSVVDKTHHPGVLLKPLQKSHFLLAKMIIFPFVREAYSWVVHRCYFPSIPHNSYPSPADLLWKGWLKSLKHMGMVNSSAAAGALGFTIALVYLHVWYWLCTSSTDSKVCYLCGLPEV